MNNKYYIYKYLLNNECIYVGKTINIFRRHKQHLREHSYFSEAETILIAECKSAIEMDIYELYYISKDHPKYNIMNTQRGECENISLPELSFKSYTQNSILNNKITYINKRNISRPTTFKIKNKYKLPTLKTEKLKNNIQIPIVKTENKTLICKIETNKLNQFLKLSFQNQRLYSYLSSFNNKEITLEPTDYFKVSELSINSGFRYAALKESLKELKENNFIDYTNNKITLLYSDNTYIEYPFKIFVTSNNRSKNAINFYLLMKYRSNNFQDIKITFSREELNEIFSYKKISHIEDRVILPFMELQNSFLELKYKYQWNKNGRLYSTLCLIKGE